MNDCAESSMKEDIVLAISKHTPFTYQDLWSAYKTVGENVERLLTTVNIACAHAVDVQFAAERFNEAIQKIIEEKQV